MTTAWDRDIERRSELTLDLFETAEDIMRENLRREFPRAGAAEIERRLRDWYLSRPLQRSLDTHIRETAVSRE